MSDESVKKIFGKNLNFFLDLNNKTQVDIVNDLGIPFSTVSSWCNGQKMPRMGNVEMLAKYFKINKSDLIEDTNNLQESGYYLNDETKEMVQELYVNPNLKILFDATRKLNKKDVQFVIDMVERLSNDNE